MTTWTESESDQQPLGNPGQAAWGTWPVLKKESTVSTFCFGFPKFFEYSN